MKEDEQIGDYLRNGFFLPESIFYCNVLYLTDQCCTQVKWLKYWTVFSSFLAADTIADALLLSYIMPGYTFLKFSFLLWTVNPWTNGSEVIFNKVFFYLLLSKALF